LEELRLPVPRTHDLEHLHTLFLPHHPSLKALLRGLHVLGQHAVDCRYPGFNTTTRQMKSALRNVVVVREELRRLLGLA
jgi:hypothetical protein